MNNERTTYALLAASMGFFVFTLIMVGPTLFASSFNPLTAGGQEAAASHVLAPNAFANVQLTAQSAAVYDTGTNTLLFEKNKDTVLPLASVTKTLSALVLKDALLQTPSITVSQRALTTDGDSGLVANEQWNVDDLIEFSLITSSNDGIEALKDAAESRTGVNMVTRINQYAADAGWSSVHVENSTGLDILGADGMPLRAGAVGSAYDVARMFAHVLIRYPNLYDATAQTGTVYTSLSGIAHTADNTNIARGDIPGLVASKTGFTDLAGGNLVVAFEPEPGRRIIVVVLGSTVDDRFTDVDTLVQRTLEYLWFE
jgi:D-alanyl-D-alanine carboxypeptidase/D-alanyl-D-alanine carboxypeptidase (penicillin-binding protein 5/6)